MASRLRLFPLDFDGHIPPPPPLLNGGLYTGEAFRAGAAYGNFPSMPDAAYMHTVNLLSAMPPTAAVRQPPPGANLRPGNNRIDHALHFRQCGPQNNVFCTSAPEDERCLGTGDQTPAPVSHDTRFSKYAHLSALGW